MRRKKKGKMGKDAEQQNCARQLQSRPHPSCIAHELVMCRLRLKAWSRPCRAVGSRGRQKPLANRLMIGSEQALAPVREPDTFVEAESLRSGNSSSLAVHRTALVSENTFPPIIHWSQCHTSARLCCAGSKLRDSNNRIHQADSQG